MLAAYSVSISDVGVFVGWRRDREYCIEKRVEGEIVEG